MKVLPGGHISTDSIHGPSDPSVPVGPHIDVIYQCEREQGTEIDSTMIRTRYDVVVMSRSASKLL